MVLQIYFTIFLAALLLAGVLAAIFGRRFIERWRYETRVQQHRRECVERDQAAREEALKEVDSWGSEESAPKARQTTSSQSGEDLA